MTSCLGSALGYPTAAGRTPRVTHVPPLISTPATPLPQPVLTVPPASPRGPALTLGFCPTIAPPCSRSALEEAMITSMSFVVLDMVAGSTCAATNSLCAVGFSLASLHQLCKAMTLHCGPTDKCINHSGWCQHLVHLACQCEYLVLQAFLQASLRFCP